MPLQDIFIEGPSMMDDFIPLSQNIPNWSNEVLDQFFKDFPFLKNAVVKVRFTKVDENNGSMIGGVDVIFSNNAVVFPLIIKRSRLTPFDVFIYEGEYFPATPDRLMQILSGQSLVEKIDESIPDQSTALHQTTQSPDMLINQPLGYTKTSSILDKIAFSIDPTAKDRLMKYIKSNPDLVALSKYPSVSNVFSKLKQSPALSKEEYDTALSEMIPTGVLQIRKATDGTYSILTSSSRFIHPVETSLNVGELDTYLKSFLEKSWPIIDAADRKGEVTISMMDEAGDVATVKETVGEVNQATTPGTYLCKTDGDVYTEGKIIPLVDFNLNPANLMLFYNSSFYAIQDQIAGKQRAGYEVPKGTTPSPGMTGTFINIKKPLAIMPFYIQSTCWRSLVSTSANDTGKTCIEGFDLQGNPVKFEYSSRFKGYAKWSSPNVEKEVPTLDDDLPTYGVSTKDFVFVELKDPVNLSKFQNAFVKTAKHKLTDRLVIKKNGDRYIMESMHLKKYASITPVLIGKIGHRKSFNFNDMDYADSKFFLATLKYMPDQADSILKKASIQGRLELANVDFPVTIAEEVDRLAKIAREKVKIPRFKVDFIKQAAATQDEIALDQTLAIDLVTPENILYFITAIPQMKQTVERLASLLVYVRLGFKDIPEKAVRDTMFGLDGIVSTLMQYKAVLEQQN
jgi:hypothetical protein